MLVTVDAMAEVRTRGRINTTKASSKRESGVKAIVLSLTTTVKTFNETCPKYPRNNTSGSTMDSPPTRHPTHRTPPPVIMKLLPLSTACQGNNFMITGEGWGPGRGAGRGPGVGWVRWLGRTGRRR